MEVNQFVEQIVSKDRKPFYILLGTDPDALETCLTAARKAVNPDFLAFNYQVFKSDTNRVVKGEDDGSKRSKDEVKEWTQIIEESSTSPFFLPPRVVVVNKAQYFEYGLEMLAQYLAKPNTDNTILLLIDSAAGKKILLNFINQGFYVDCQAPQKHELPFWLIKQMAKKGLTLTEPGARTMLDRLGRDNLGVLISEAEKLSIYPGPSVKYTPKEINELVSLGPTAIMYELGDPVAEQDLGKAIGVLLDLAEKTPPMVLMYTVVSQFLKIIKLKYSLETAIDEALVTPQSMQLHPFVYGKLKIQSKRWSWGQLAGAVEAIMRAHRALISASTPQIVVLEQLTVFLGTYLKRLES